MRTQSRPLRNARDYVDGVLEIVNRASAVDVFCMHQVFPYALYPVNEEAFLTVRAYESRQRSTLMGAGGLVTRYFKAFQDAYKRGTTFRYVMGISSVDYYRRVMQGSFDRGAAVCLKQVKANLESIDVDIRVGENAPDYCMFLNGVECLFAVIDPKEPGTVIRDPISIRIHQKKFDQEYSRGYPLDRWWPDILANRECNMGGIIETTTRSGLKALAFIPGAFLYRGKKFALSGKPLEILRALTEAPSRTLSLEQLHDKIWSGERDGVGEETIRSAVHAARKALRKALKTTNSSVTNPIRNVERGSRRTAWCLDLP